MANFDVPAEGSANWGPRVAGSLSYLFETQQLKYTKPTTGIPAADLDSATRAIITSAAAAYNKPTDGIPLSDLAASVQTTLNDSASRAYTTQTINSALSTLPTGGPAIKLGAFSFGGCSASQTYTAGSSATRTKFQLTVNASRARVHFRNYNGLTQNAPASTGLSVGDVWIGPEDKSDTGAYKYTGSQVKVASGGDVANGAIYTTDWFTPSFDTINTPALLTYVLNASQGGTSVYTQGGNSVVTFDTTKASENVPSTWVTYNNLSLEVWLEYEFADTDTGVVVFVGDSTADSYTQVAMPGFTGQLGGFPQRWARQTNNVAVVNAFASSKLTDWNLSSLNWIRRFIGIKPDAVVVSLGSNDAGEGITINTFRSRYLIMLQAARSVYPGVPIYAVSMVPFQGGTADQQTLREAINDFLYNLDPGTIAGVFNAGVLELPGSATRQYDPRYMSPDNTHPSTRGQAVLANQIDLDGVSGVKSRVIYPNAGYMKPSDGIPQTDLTLDLSAKVDAGASAVQPAGLTKAAVGLGNVDNTSDVAKPVSTAQQTALDAKAPTTHTHTVSQLSDATANGRSLISATDYAAMKTLLTINNVSNTSDANKPVSTAQATAIRTKSITTITYAATITPNAASGNIQRVTLTGNTTVAVPTNPVDGQQIMFEFFASGADRTVTLTTGTTGSFKFGTTITTLPVVTSATTLRVGVIYRSAPGGTAANARWDVLAVAGGF
jgi:lysophospholipase L1-like esterase